MLKMDMDVKIPASMTARTEILDAKDQLTGVSVQDLVDAFCDFLDGTQDHDVVNHTGCQEMADRIIAVRAAVKNLWSVNR